MLMPGFLPGLLAPKGYAGREKVVATFQRYFAANGAETGSVLTKARHKVLKRYFSAEDIARYECVNGLAILLNSVPTAFWTTYHIFSEQELLKTVRHHVENITTVKEDGGRRLRVIDLARLKEIPILASVVQESLRFRTTGVGPRMAMEDIMLSNRYLIKKGYYFVISSHEMHFDQRIWGDTTNTFDAQRFTKSDTKKVPSAAFRGFVGGVNLCPGKGFAMAEIIAFIALLTARFDLKPESGHWTGPGQDLSNISL